MDKRIINEARRVINEASKTLSECSKFITDKEFIEGLAEEISVVVESTKDISTHEAVFGETKDHILEYVGIYLKGTEVEERYSNITRVPLDNSDNVTKLNLLRESMTDFALKLGKTENYLKDKFIRSVTERTLDTNKSIEDFSDTDLKLIEESVKLQLSSSDTELTPILKDGTDMKAITECLSSLKRKEAMKLLEDIVKLDMDDKKRRMLEKLLKEPKNENI